MEGTDAGSALRAAATAAKAAGRASARQLPQEDEDGRGQQWQKQQQQQEWDRERERQPPQQQQQHQQQQREQQRQEDRELERQKQPPGWEYHINRSAFKDTLTKLNKNIYFGDNTVLTINWNSLVKTGFTTTAVVTTGELTGFAPFVNMTQLVKLTLLLYLNL